MNHEPIELFEWKELIKTPEWRQFEKLIIKHINYLQEQVNRYVRQGDYRMADRAEAKMEDAVKIMDLVSEQIKALKKGG